MKKIQFVLTVIMMMCAGSTFAGKPPAPVVKAFEQKFPGSMEVVWLKESSTIWEAIFQIDGVRGSVEFSLDGTWIETQVAIKDSELPAGARNKIVMDYPGWTILEVNKIDMGESGIIYSVDLQKGIIKKVFGFKEDGTLVAQE